MTLSIDDRLDLHELSARYAHALDDGDADAFAALFAQDGTVLLPDGRTIAGTKQLMELATTMAHHAPGMRHLVVNIVIEASPGGARGSAYFYTVRVSGDGALRMRNLGRYHDEYRRTGDGWRFASRRIAAELGAELVDAPFGFTTA